MDQEKATVEANNYSHDSTTSILDDAVSPVDEKSVILDPSIQKKIREVEEACQIRDLPRLRRLAESDGGFLSDEARRRAWPMLLGVSTASTAGLSESEVDAAAEKTVRWQDLPEHGDEEQVDKDVERSFIHYPPNPSQIELTELRADLKTLIVQILRRYPYLNYFQGYHDICQVFLLVLGLDKAVPAVARLSVLRIRDFMLPTLDASHSHLLLLPDLLSKAAPKLWRHIVGVKPWFALAPTITMFAHNIDRYHNIARLFDVLLAHEPVFNLYLFTQSLLDRQDEIFEIEDDDMLHVILGRVSPNLDLDELITNSIPLFDRYPPQTLRSWRDVSDASVLKTARDVDHSDEQTMAAGRVYFKQLDQEITEQKAKERLWAARKAKARMAARTLWLYRRPAGAMGMAVIVGLSAFQIRREPAILNFVFTFFSR
ncbi:rab-GTPase-TBC domain-containing protein [Sarocladium implicatum]|nr:rab-GTPase-TBC domain-containing protein [Sarocladium implicatum]